MGDPTGVVNIRGKDYQTVALRVAQFRADHPEWGIRTTLYQDGDQCLAHSMIVNGEGFTLSDGHASETKEKGGIMKTSHIEVAETSAVGRALAFLGYQGEELGIASANEVQTAIAQQGSATARVAQALKTTLDAQRKPFDTKRLMDDLADMNEFEKFGAWMKYVQDNAPPSAKGPLWARFAQRCGEVNIDPAAVKEAVAS